LHAAICGGRLDFMAAGFRRAALGATSRLRAQLRAAASRPRGWLGWRGAEIVLALAVGVAAFVLAAAACAAARSHLPAVLFGCCCWRRC
jgi:hypothetical protein